VRNPPAHQRKSLAALRHLERAVTGASGLVGIALRYGNLYGPGSGMGRGGVFPELLRKREFPIVGEGTGVWSFLHVDDAASANAAALERARPASTTRATTSPRRSRSGCRSWRATWAPRRRGGSRSGSRVSSSARSASR
jgi:2-alkyl-3-oxoalkanoate reductase